MGAGGNKPGGGTKGGRNMPGRGGGIPAEREIVILLMFVKNKNLNFKLYTMSQLRFSIIFLSINSLFVSLHAQYL